MCYLNKMNVGILFLTILFNNVNTEHNEICEKCVAKCCPANQYILNTECEPKTSNVPDFSTIGVYDVHKNRNGNLSDRFTIVTRALFKENDVLNGTGFIGEDSSFSLQLDEAGDSFEIYNDMYCVDFYSENDNTTEPQIMFWFLISNSVPATVDKLWVNLKLAVLLINGFFLLLVIIAIFVVKKLRDLKGKIRLSFVINLFGLYAVLGSEQYYISYVLNGSIPDKTCLFFTTITYYFYWASCCWMNISAYNLWTSLRSFRAVAAIQPQYWDLDRRMFIKFFAYAFVVPGVLALIFNIIYFQKNSAETVNITTNGQCSLSQTKEKIFEYYLHTTMLLLNLITLVIYVLMARYLWKRKRQSKRQFKNVNKNELQKMGLIMHIKIWTLTGMVWIIDVLSIYFMNDSKIWDVLDLISLSSGFALFIIIICNKRTLFLIYERFTTRRC